MEKGMIELIEDSMGIKIKEVVNIPDNEVFTKSSEMIVSGFTSEPKVSNYIWAESIPMNTIVETPKGHIMKVHNSLDFHIIGGSVCRYSSFVENELELTRIRIPRELRGRGLGSGLLTITLMAFEESLGTIPPIRLECTGAIGIGRTYEEIGLEDQIQFFSKFGFEISHLDKRRGYAIMRRPSLPAPSLSPSFGSILPYCLPNNPKNTQ